MRIFVTAVGLALLGLVPSVAQAGLKICNDTEASQTVAIGYKSGDDWVSEGWWNIDAGDCKTTVAGDLKQRYYYYLSKSRGWTFDDGNIVFCSTSDVFTIVGDEDCAARGYDKSYFRKIDTGKTAKDYTQNLAAYTTRSAAAPAPAPKQTPSTTASQPGTYGEPYSSGTAIFQSCEDETEARFCTFHDNGYKFHVYDDGRTPNGVIARLRGYLPGTPIEVQGDLESVYDRSADLVMRAVLPRAWNRWDSTLGRMQGQWYAEGDPASMFTVLGSERINTYDGNFVGIEYLSLQESCDHYEGGEILVIRDEASGDVLCYTIEDMGDWAMTLMYLPRGNFHAFRKLD